jgi:LysM repeat protein
MPKDISTIRRKRWFHFNIFPWMMGVTFLIISGLFYYNWPLIEPNLIVPSLVPTGEQPVIAAIIPITGASPEEASPTVEFPATDTDTPVPTVTSTPVDTVEPTETLTQQSTSTELPTNTPQPPHALQTPFGFERQYLIHRVLGGETLEWIAKNHGTSVEAIRAANYGMTTSLWEDSMLVIPFNQTDIDGIIPMTAFKVTGEEISIETLAEEKEIHLLLLCQVNDRPHSYVFVPGEWVLIPHLATPTAP